MATTHTVTTTHDLGLARSYVAFRNEMLWPTRKLQRVLIAACVVAVGFMFVPGPLRYTLWAIAALVVPWVVFSDQFDAARRFRTDPHRDHSVTHVFTPRGFYQDVNEAGGVSAESEVVTYAQIVALHSDADHWIVRVASGDLVMLARDGVDAGTTTTDRFESFLIARTRLGIEPVQRSLRSKIERAQDGRRDYVDAHPNLLTRSLRKRSDATPPHG